MPQVVEINDIGELEDFRLLWDSLLWQTRGATFFQTLDWLEAYWRHFGQGQKLRLLIVSAGRPIGILPLTVIREQTRLGSVGVLTYPLDGWGTFFGPIGPNPTATLLAGMRHIAATPRDWDIVDLRGTDADGHDAGRTANVMRAVGLPAEKQQFVRAAQIELDAFRGEPVGNGGCPRSRARAVPECLFDCDSWHSTERHGGRSLQTAERSADRAFANYWSSRKPRFRQNIARAERRLAQCGDVTYIRYRPEGNRYGDGDPRWDLYDACEEIARRSWQGGATDGTTLSHDSVRDYLRDAHESAAAAGGLDLNLLLVGSRPAAFAYNYHYHGSVYGLRTGFDPEISTEGSGSVLLRRMIEDSFARGDHLIDLGPDSLEVKRHWATRMQTSYHYPHYAPLGMRAQALRMKRWLASTSG